MADVAGQLAALMKQLQALPQDQRLVVLNKVGLQPGAMLDRGVEPQSGEDQEIFDRGWHSYMAGARTGDKAVDPNMKTGAPATVDKTEISTGKYSKLGGMLDFDHDPMKIGFKPAPAYDPDKGYTDQYNTKLPPDEEARYQAWGAQEAAKRQDHRNPAQDTYDYDMRGFWKSGGQFAGNGHAGDTFKKPNHPTFSSLSQYSTPEMPGGTWNHLPDGSWTFTPTAHNLKYNDAGDLQQYFQKEERGNKLILPQAAAPTATPAVAPIQAAPTPTPATPVSPVAKPPVVLGPKITPDAPANAAPDKPIKIPGLVE